MAKAKESNGEKSKSDMVREMIGKGITSPKEIVEAVKSTYNTDVTVGLVSNIKSTDAKKNGKAKANRYEKVQEERKARQERRKKEPYLMENLRRLVDDTGIAGTRAAISAMLDQIEKDPD